MTIFNPVYRIKINNTEVTNITLGGLTITNGRTDIYSQPEAGYCNLTLLETNLDQINWDINDSVSIEVKNSANNYVYIFGGFITDLNIIVTSSGSIATVQKINIIAVGALARLARTIFTGNLPHQFDGERIEYLIGLVLFDSWNEVSASLQWNNYNATTTWLNAENSGAGEIDTPGDYELHSQNDLDDTIYNLASYTARSGLGYLYEDAQGLIGYADSTHRGEYLTNNGYLDLDGNQAIGPELQISKIAGNVRNSITIGYGTSGQSVTDSDPVSMITYGELADTIDTSLRHQADAVIQADYYLTIRAYPQFELRQIVFPLTSPEMDNNTRDALLNVFMGLPVNITNLPINMVDGAFQGFIEGWTWRASLNSLSISLSISPTAYSLQAFRWDSVPAVETWQTISPTLEWLNATIVA